VSAYRRQLQNLSCQGIEGQRKVAEAGLGPVRYLATLLGADSETALRWFVLVGPSGIQAVPRPLRNVTIDKRTNRHHDYTIALTTRHDWGSPFCR
jgi:hypothetical protein